MWEGRVPQSLVLLSVSAPIAKIVFSANNHQGEIYTVGGLTGLSDQRVQMG